MTSCKNYSQYYVFGNKQMAYCSLFFMILYLAGPISDHKLPEGSNLTLHYISNISIAHSVLPA